MKLHRVFLLYLIPWHELRHDNPTIIASKLPSEWQVELLELGMSGFLPVQFGNHLHGFCGLCAISRAALPLHLYHISKPEIKLPLFQEALFTHPYEKAPTKEETRFVIAHIVEIALSRQLYHRKQFIDNELQNLQVPHYLIDDGSVISQHAIVMLSRIAPDLFAYFFKSLLYEIGQRRLIASELKIVRRLRAFLMELVKIQSQRISQNAAEFRLEHYAGNFPRELLIGCCSRDTWQMLPERIQQMLIDFLLDNIGEQFATISPTHIVLEVFNSGLLSSIQSEQFTTRLAQLGFEKLANFLPFNDIVAQAILTELNTGDFNRIIPVISYLRNIDGDGFSSVAETKLLQIGRKILSNASGNSWACQDYIRDSVRNITRMPEAMCAGLFLGQLYPYDNNYFPRYTYLQYILPLCKSKFSRASLDHWVEVFAVAHPVEIIGADEILKTIEAYPMVDENLKREIKSWT